jgi:hypothetical protein
LSLIIKYFLTLKYNIVLNYVNSRISSTKQQDATIHIVQVSSRLIVNFTSVKFCQTYLSMVDRCLICQLIFIRLFFFLKI